MQKQQNLLHAHFTVQILREFIHTPCTCSYIVLYTDLSNKSYSSVVCSYKPSLSRYSPVMVLVYANLVMMITDVVRRIVYNRSTLTVRKEHIDHKMEIVSHPQSGKATVHHRCIFYVATCQPLCRNDSYTCTVKP